jgi:hypothetical protein
VVDLGQGFLRPIGCHLEQPFLRPVSGKPRRSLLSPLWDVYRSTNIKEKKNPIFPSISVMNGRASMQEHSLLAPGMDLDMDDPYEEAEAEAAAEAAGLGGPAAEDSSDEDDSEAESDYEEKSFALLRSGKHQVRYPDGTFRCPFCPGKKKRDYKLKDLLQHADGIGVSSKHRRHGRQRAVHRAFAQFVRTDPSFSQELAGITGIPGAIAPADANGANATAEADVSAAAAAAVAPRLPEVEKYAWPWVCVLAADLGFNPEDFASRVVMCSFVEVIPLFLDEIEDGETFAIVRFTNDWSGFNDVLTLENHFSVNKLGKNEWITRNNGQDAAKVDGGKDEVKVYGWIAREEDYNAVSLVGRFLRKHTNLKTINDVSKLFSERSEQTVAALASHIEAKNRYLLDLETKKNATEFAISQLEVDNRKLHEAYSEGNPSICSLFPLAVDGANRPNWNFGNLFKFTNFFEV